jgi:hypothetical protein
MELRYNHSAWRALGYIPNIDRAVKYSSVEDGHRDYHACVRVIMSEMVEYMKLGGIDWVFAYGEKEVPCTLQIPINSSGTMKSSEDWYRKIPQADRHDRTNRGRAQECQGRNE